MQEEKGRLGKGQRTSSTHLLLALFEEIKKYSYCVQDSTIQYFLVTAEVSLLTYIVVRMCFITYEPLK